MARTFSAASAKAITPRQRQFPAVAAEDSARYVAAQPPSALSLSNCGVRVHDAGSLLLAASAAFLQMEFTAPCMKTGVLEAMSDSMAHASALASRHVWVGAASLVATAMRTNHVEHCILDKRPSVVWR